MLRHDFHGTLTATGLSRAWLPRNSAFCSDRVSIQSSNPVDRKHRLASTPRPLRNPPARRLAPATASPRAHRADLLEPQSLTSSSLLKNSRTTQSSQASPARAALACALCLKPIGGADRDRTDDPLLAKQVLSQLSYSPPSHTPRNRATHPITCAQALACANNGSALEPWWVWLDLHQRPHAYQACALTN